MALIHPLRLPFLLPFFIVILPIHSTFLTTPTPSPPCVSRCRFKFCDGTSTVLLIASRDIAIPPPICSSDDARIVTVSQTDEPRALVKGFLRPISTLRASQSFSPSFFKILGLSDGVGVAHETPQGDQALVADGRCFVLPIVRFQIRRRFITYNGIGGRRADCVAFTAELPVVVVELTWDSPDDLDLVVFDPTGEELSVSSAVETRTGTLLADDGVSKCGEPRARGREVSVYRGAAVRTGQYVALVKHWENCGNGARWRLRVSVRGQTVAMRSGYSRADDDLVVIGSTLRFKVPKV